MIGLRAALGLAIAGVLAGCGESPTVLGATPTAGAGLSAELQGFATFPVNASPRPIVLIGGPIDGPDRFDDGPAKEAFLGGGIAAPAHFPGGPARAGGFPLIGAADAFAMLLSQTGFSNGGETLQVLRIRLGEWTFLTDRGNKQLPAWLFSLSHSSGSVAVLAVSPRSQWAPPGLPGGTIDAGARMAADDRAFDYGFTGAAAGTGPCTASYGIQLLESRTAVLVKLSEHINFPPGQACALIGYHRTVRAVLSQPLGARLMVDGRTGRLVVASGGP
jgi:hypothetical protein